MGTDVETWGVAILWAPCEKLPRETHACTHIHTHTHTHARTHQHNTPTQTQSHARKGLSHHLPSTGDSVYAYPTCGHLFLNTPLFRVSSRDGAAIFARGGVHLQDLAHPFFLQF